MFWMHFFALQIFEHFASTPIPQPTTPPVGGRGVQGGYGWGWVEIGVFLDSF